VRGSPLTVALKGLVDDATGELSSSENESVGDALDEDVAIVGAAVFLNTEIEERVGAVVIANEEGGELGIAGEAYPSMEAVIGSGAGFECRVATIPIVDVGRRSLGSLRESGGGLSWVACVGIVGRGWIGEANGIESALFFCEPRGRVVVEQVLASIGEDGEVGSDVGGLGFEEQMVVLSDVVDGLDVAGGEPDEGLARLELEVDLVAGDAGEIEDVIGAVGNDANARIARI